MTSKILIMTEMMMPFAKNWGACQRIYHYGKKMVAEGIRVTVICHNISDRIDGTEDVDGIRVIGRGGRKTAAPANDSSAPGFKAKLRKKLQAVDRNTKLISGAVRSSYRFVYSEPSMLSGRTSKRWADSVMPFALQFIKDEGIDTVILSGPTVGLFYHAKEIKAAGVRLILDYRDPWVSWYEKPTLASGAERRAVQSADLVVTTTETLTEALNKKYSTSKCHTVMNGYDKEQWASVTIPDHDKEHLMIAYVGNIKVQKKSNNFGFRDSRCFLETVGEFIKTHPETRVAFVGVQNDPDEIEPKFKEYVEFRGPVPLREALEITARADVLLMFHTPLDSSGKYIICGKAFDCMRSGNYMLSIGYVAYANKAFVEKTGSGIHCENNREAIMNALETIYKKWKEGSLAVENRDTEQYSRDYQNTEFLRLIRAL